MQVILILTRYMQVAGLSQQENVHAFVNADTLTTKFK